MKTFKLIEDYLIDQDDGLKKLLTRFLNLVCNWKQYRNPARSLMSEIRQEQLNGMAIRSGLSRRALVN